MTPEKILSVVSMYEVRLQREGIQPKRMDTSRTFSSLNKKEVLAHAYYLIGGIKELVANPEKQGKTGRHLGSLQTCLSFADWYTLDELMNHNRP
jgi:hypothetical protein